MRMHAYILSARHCVHAHVRGMAASQSTIDTMTDHKYGQAHEGSSLIRRLSIRKTSSDQFPSIVTFLPALLAGPARPLHQCMRASDSAMPPQKKNLCTRVVQRCLSSTTQLPSICSWIELGCAQNGFSTGPCCPRTMVSQLHGRISHGRTTDNSDHDESTSDKRCCTGFVVHHRVHSSPPTPAHVQCSNDPLVAH